jgi:hypothetical protein
VLNAKCTRYNFVVSACSVDYDDRLSGTMPATKFEATTTLNYLMGGSVAGERVALMHSTAHSAVVTSAVGMDHLANRIFTMLVFLVIFAGTPLIIIVKLATGRLGADTVAVAPAAAPDPQAIDAEIARQVAARAQQGAPSTRISSTLAPPASAGTAAPAGTFGRRTSFR